jgi:hypothetical protein
MFIFCRLDYFLSSLIFTQRVSVDRVHEVQTLILKGSLVWVTLGLRFLEVKPLRVVISLCLFTINFHIYKSVYKSVRTHAHKVDFVETGS